jgi:hypothetical protein
MLTSNEPKAKLAVLLKSVFIPPPLIAAEYKLSVHSPKLLLVYFSRFGTMLQRFGHIAWAFVSGAPDMRTNVIRKSDVVKSEASLVSWLYEEPSPWKI